MLVEHDVEAELVAQQPLVVIAVKKIGRILGSRRRFGRLTRSEPSCFSQAFG
jgi:hypothetical protein